MNTRGSENEQTSHSSVILEQERRKHTRYEIGNSVSVNSEGAYQIIDISEGGFRFKCPPHTAIADTWVTDIINSVIPLEGVPARKIWVSMYKNGNYNLPSLILVGAKFGKLKQEQKLKLIQLVQSFIPNQILKDH